MQNIGFSYGSCLESQSDVVDVRFDDLHHARYASCATDIHNLLYYTVDADIRRDHTVNLLAVYHDHFAKVRQFGTVLPDSYIDQKVVIQDIYLELEI